MAGEMNQTDARRDTIFKDAVLSAAEAESDGIIQNARQAAAMQLEEAQATCKLADHDTMAKTMAVDTEREHSAALQAARKDLLAYRGQLVDEMFAEVTRRLAEFTASEQYPAWLAAQLKAAALPAGAGAAPVVWVRAADIAHEQALKKALPGCEVRADEEIALGGLRLQHGYIEYDMTMDAALAGERERFTQTSGLTV